MDSRVQREGRQDSKLVVTRREVMAGGGALLGGLLLTGCGETKPGKAAALRDGADEDAATYTGKMYDAAPSYASPTTTAQPTWPPAQTPQIYQPPAPAPTQAATSPAQVIPRTNWTRLGVARPREIYAMGRVNRITVHHDGMPVAALRSTRDVATRIEQIRAAHVNGRGWADIGYHYIIDPSGRVWEGRNIYYQGAHVKDQNENNLGVLVLGNFEAQRPSAQALSTLDRFVAAQMQRYAITLSRVRTHREMAQTSCPGRNLQATFSTSRASGQLASMASRAGLARG